MKETFFGAMYWALAAAVFCILLVGCEESPVQEPVERSESIPAEAVWVGGADGGVYVKLQLAETEPRREYQADVYYEDGSVAYSGILVQEAGGAVAPTPASAALSGWDGEALYLEQGGALVIPERLGEKSTGGG